MAVLNVRIPDEVHDQLKALADDRGVTLSEYVRDLALAEVRPVHRKTRGAAGDEPAPESLSSIERKTLSLLHRILARVLPEDADDVDGDRAYQLERAVVLEEGFTGEYWWEMAGFRTELSIRECDLVDEILQMFRIITFSLQHLQNEDQELPRRVTARLSFDGFDHNDPLEGHMAAYVRHQMRDPDSWTELRPQLEKRDNGNSHSPMLPTYQRMLATYRRIIADRDRRATSRTLYLLTADELGQIADASTHPAHREP